MMFCIDIAPHTLHFKQPVGTSRGVYLTRKTWFITLSSPEKPGVKGVGECAPLPNLSCDDLPNYEDCLRHACQRLCETGEIQHEELLSYPSIRFGLECALWQWQRNGDMALSQTPFGRGEMGIPINGLVWMGTFEEMAARIEEKLKQGFRCVKLKIGAIDFERELQLLGLIRNTFSRQEVELRVDANGAFAPNEALAKLDKLATLDIHSIEQPIAKGQWHELAKLCKHSPLPIALDEELIGANSLSMKETLLDTISPQYLVLKPSLHGGIAGTKEWIELAQKRNIVSWITSALESNVGLNAIAHLTSEVYGPQINMPQGLGTGQLFTDNIAIPLQIKGDNLWFLPNF